MREAEILRTCEVQRQKGKRRHPELRMRSGAWGFKGEEGHCRTIRADVQ